MCQKSRWTIRGYASASESLTTSMIGKKVSVVGRGIQVMSVVGVIGVVEVPRRAFSDYN